MQKAIGILKLHIVFFSTFYSPIQSASPAEGGLIFTPLISSQAFWENRQIPVSQEPAVSLRYFIRLVTRGIASVKEFQANTFTVSYALPKAVGAKS